MNPQQSQLYQQIQAFSLDDPDARWCFSRRLAKEKGWSDGYTQRVIAEYKKFAFLAVAAGHPVSPSEPVDQVWHLHLTYTRSYWQEFCPQILQMPLHHEPSRGGSSERDKYNDWYNKTLASYEHFFGYAPPNDIWLPLHIHINHSNQFVPVNRQQNWIVPKPSLDFLPKIDWNQPAIMAVLFVLTLAVSGCASSLQSGTFPNPLNLTGPTFLALYVFLGLVSIILGVLQGHYLRLPAGNSAVELDLYETAYLSSGYNRVVDTAITSLVQGGQVEAHRASWLVLTTTNLEQINDPLERVVAAAIKTYGNLYHVRASTPVNRAGGQIRQRLEQLQLLLNQKQADFVRICSALPIFALLALGITKILVGISRGKPVGFLLFLCIITAVIGWRFLSTSPFRSRLGDHVLANIQNQLGRSTVTSSTDPQLPMAFAVLGAGVLAGSTVAGLKRVFIPRASAGGGGGGNDGCGGGSDSCGGGGDGGGGGGGCGGCGGGD